MKKPEIIKFINNTLSKNDNVENINNNLQKIYEFMNENEIKITGKLIESLLSKSKKFLNNISIMFQYYKEFIIKNQLSFISDNIFLILSIEQYCKIQNIEIYLLMR